MLTVTSFDHVVFNVRDVEVSAAWYARVLGMRRHDSPSPGGSMRFGRHKINLRPVEASHESWITAQAPSPGCEDLCFLTDAPPDAVVGHLVDLGVAIVTGPVTRSGAEGPIRSVYVRDPDGSLIEIASYADAQG